VVTVHVEDSDGDSLTVNWSVDGSPVQSDTVPAGGPPTSADLTLPYSFAPGPHTVEVTVSDGVAAAVSCSVIITVADTTRPTLACPADIPVPCSVNRLLPVSFTVTAEDDCDPAPLVTCSPTSGSDFAIGLTTVECTATDTSGNSATCSFVISRAALGFTGFHPPVGGADATGGSFADPLRTFKLGSTVPVKFTATCDGSPVLTGVHTLQLVKWSNGTDSDPAIDATPRDAATTGNQFRLTGDQWHFNLDTKPLSKGVWQLIATLSDGSQHSVWIQLK
jgi:hypothetical protein